MTTIDLQVPHVIWWKDPALRKLYLAMPVLMLAATINGYDGSLLNGLQTMDSWQNCKCSIHKIRSWRMENVAVC